LVTSGQNSQKGKAVFVHIVETAFPSFIPLQDKLAKIVDAADLRTEEDSMKRRNSHRSQRAGRLIVGI